MALNYALFENHLTTDPTDYMAVVQNQQSKTQDDVIDLYMDDLASGARNETLTPGNIAQLKGSRLKFDPADAAQGIFLVAPNGSETRAASISRNKPGQIDFLVPPLAAGTYHLEVRASVYHNSAARTGTLPAELNVIA